VWLRLCRLSRIDRPAGRDRAARVCVVAVGSFASLYV